MRSSRAAPPEYCVWAYVLALSVVVKISDGATRAAYPVALWALEATGHLPSEQVQQLLPQVTRPVIGGVQDNAPREVGGWGARRGLGAASG